MREHAMEPGASDTSPSRLDQLTLASLASSDIATPSYDRRTMTASIVHLGLGAFARAHLCAYLDAMLGAGHDDMAVIGVSLRHEDVRRALAPQDWLYTLGVTGETAAYRVIGSIIDVVHAPTDPSKVRSALAATTTTAVTITVTEKGYCWLPDSRRLDPTHPDIIHDIAEPTAPTSLPGHLVLAALDRREHGSGPLTVLSLDNLPANGRTLARVVGELAARIDPSLPSWIDEHMAFPCSMVDRMVPATTDVLRAEVEREIGLEDRWPVRSEPFSQWVVERRWATAQPPLDQVGVRWVDDIGPWETMKLRALNGLHTCAAHYGLAHGLETVDAVTRDPGGRALLDQVASEVLDVVRAPDGVSVSDYIATTMLRFANPSLGHRCAQIATDSSQKLPQRLLATLSERTALGLKSDGIVEVLALWAWSTLGIDHEGRPRQVNDPLASVFETITAQHATDPAGLVGALLVLREVFGHSIDRDRLGPAIAERLVMLRS